MLGPSVVKANATTLQNNFQDTMSENVLESLTPANLNTAFGDDKGNLDESKVKQYITDQEASNPEVSGSPDDPTTTAGQAFHIIKAVWDGVRAGERAVDVLKTAGKMSFSDNNWHTAYKVGAFHLATVVLGGAYLGLSLSGHTPTDPGQIIADVGSGINTMGALIVGAGRAIRSSDSPDVKRANAQVTSATAAKNTADSQVDAAQATLDGAKTAEATASDAHNKAVTTYNQALQDLTRANATEANLEHAARNAKTAVTAARNAYLQASRDPGANASAARADLARATTDFDKANAALVDQEEQVTRAQTTLDAAKTNLSAKTAELHAATISAPSRINAAENNLKTAEAASTQANQDLSAAMSNLKQVKNQPVEKAKQKSPSVGRAVGGVGNVVQGIGLIIYGSDLKKAGDVALGNINIAQGAFWTTVGASDAVDGTIKFFGDSLGKIKIPSFAGLTSLGDVAPLISTAGDVLGSIGGLGLTLAGVILQLEAEKKEAVNETHTTDATLTRYGISGGPTTPQDVTEAGPLGNPTPLPGGVGGVGGGSGPRPG